MGTLEPPVRETPSDASLPEPLAPAALRGLLLVAAGCLFTGMAVWTLVLDPRPTPAPWDGWRLRDVILTLAGAYCLRGMAGGVWTVVLMDLGRRGWAPVPTLTRNLGSAAWQTLACLVAVGAFALAPYGLDIGALGLTPASPAWLAAGAAAGFVAGPGLLVGFALLVRAMGQRLPLESKQLEFLAPNDSTEARPWAAVAGMVLVAAVLGPFAEEVLFRGVVYPGLRNLLGPWAAVPLSAALFGLGHRYMGWTGVWVTGVVGVVLSLLVEFSASLWPAVLAHVLVNSKLVLVYIPWFRPAVPAASGTPRTEVSE
jgi:membrane protease YdiL (CAAX protease family)